MKVNKKGGNIETKHRFKDYQLHVEYRIPEDIAGTSQGRGNSGVFLASTGGGDAGYELQILDNYNNKTYVNGMAGSMYKQAIPLANPCRKPGEWQYYDVVWTAPRFKSDGTLETPAYVTVIFNGVLVENHFQLKGETLYIGKPIYKPTTPPPSSSRPTATPARPSASATSGCAKSRNTAQRAGGQARLCLVNGFRLTACSISFSLCRSAQAKAYATGPSTAASPGQTH